MLLHSPLDALSLSPLTAEIIYGEKEKIYFETQIVQFEEQFSTKHHWFIYALLHG